ncbi:MAG: choice-of-anchor V domain-containing protein [Saprospiraceae bacterium]|nr:choice-of-anchor V domain-containing protein [Saprospiraceae bacterium]
MKRQQYFLFVFLLAVVAAFNSAYNPSNPPTGRTGAPGELTCQASGCHGGGTFTGTVNISGVPDTVFAGQSYPITLTQASNAEVGGFQLTALDNANMRAGTLQQGSGSNVTTSFNGRQYVRQSFPKDLTGGNVSWTFNWTAPNSAAGNRITFYFSSLAANGNGGSSGDNVLVNNRPVTLTTMVSAFDPQNEAKVSITPTLVSEAFRIELLESATGYLHLFDHQGRLVREQPLNGLSTIPVADLPKGIYIVRVQAEGKLKSERIVVQ